MNNQNLVVTVRLSDVDENDQPDPICLPVEELATWRHFEALLQSMYVNPPAAIRVCYLDDESDWIELSSDIELQEAIKVAQDTDEILQLQVKREDVTPHYVSTLNSLPPRDTDGPHVTPLQTTYYKDRIEPLVYPHPSNTNTHNGLTHYPPSSPHNTQNIVQPLVYPYPNNDTPVDRQNENVIVMEADGRTASIHNRPDLSTQEKVQRLKTRLSSPKGDDKTLKGLNSCMSFGEMWQQASNYSSEEKIKFMKSMVTGESEGVVEKKDANSTKSKEGQQGASAKEKTDLLIEPLSTEPVASSSTSTVQDPFEVVCQDKPSRDLEQIQLNFQPGNILIPQKPNNSPGNSETDGAVVPKTAAVNIERVVEQVHAAAKPSLVKSNGGHNSNVRSSAVLVEVAPPVPLPRTLQMMEGAQSGANAVAIEIPEGYHHGAAQKEEDVTASGGAACTSASAETGESIGNRPGHHGAAVSHKVKVPPGRHCGEAATFQHSGTSANRSSSKKGKKSESSKPSGGATGSKGKKDVIPKEAGNSSTSTKRRSSSLQMKKRSKDKELGGSLKEDRKGVKVEADVESGEKVVDVGDTSLHYQDFATYMKRMKEDLHFHIVKDVTKKTDQLLRKTWCRSQSYDPSLTRVHDDNSEVVHKKIYCDSCNTCIRGIRYKCGNCADFDLCEKCEMTSNTHDQSHVFLVLRRPVFMAGWIDKKKVPLLKDIIYKDDAKPVMKEKPKLEESLEDVPILSISEVATPGGKHSPLNTPSESHRADSANWVWDSTFDTDHKLLYPLEGEGHSEAIRPFELLTPSKESVDSQSRLSETEINRLITLLSIEQEAARQMSNTVNIDGEEEEEENLQDTEIIHQPILANATPSVCEECPVNGREEVERQRISYSDDTQAIEGNADIENNNNDTFENQHHSQDEKESQTSEEFLEADEDFVELESDRSDVNDEDEVEEEREVEVVRHHHSSCRGDHSDSDSSDDFCILDPPSSDECEACIVEFPVVPPVKAQEEQNDQGDEDFQHVVTNVSSTETVEHDQVEKEADGLVVEVIHEATPIEPVVAEVLNRMSEEICNAEEASREESTDGEVAVEQDATNAETKSNNMVDDNDDDDGNMAAAGGATDDERKGSHEAVMSHQEEDVLMNMTMEERCRFLDMVKILKERAEDLENELKTHKEAEAQEQFAKQEEMQYQMILEEKQKEAARENEKLEEQKRKEQEEKLRKQKQLEKERKARQKELRHNAVTNRKKSSGTSTNGGSPTLMQMALIPRDQAASTGQKSRGDGDESKPTAVLTNVTWSAKRDANCQTGTGGADAAAQASQMIQTVANGVSKAAEAAYHTAKDVFYSLQAKQVEKKEYPGVVYSKTVSNDTPGQTQEKVWTPPSSVWTPPTDTYIPADSTWTPPSSEWKPPTSTWTPPKSDWTGPKSEWTPPKSVWKGPESDWTPPKSQWNPPAGYYQQPDLESENIETPESQAARLSHCMSKDGDLAKSCDKPDVVKTSTDQDSLSTAPIPPIQPTQITDPVLRREVQGMQILIEMGFANREHNRRLLQKYNGDVEKAVQMLLQEERGEHWAFQRH